MQTWSGRRAESKRQHSRIFCSSHYTYSVRGSLILVYFSSYVAEPNLAMIRQCISIALVFCATVLFGQSLLMRFGWNSRLSNLTRIDADNARYSVNIGFSPFQIETVRRLEAVVRDAYQVTAILLHWKRLEFVELKVKRYIASQLFKHIIIWNNDPQINLTLTHLRLKNPPVASIIRIINSPINLKDQAKYRACAEATTPVCFYSDDDWDTSAYINSLLASFRADPEVLHTVTEPYTFYSNLVWTYFDASIDLHAGFTWIGCGSVFLRVYAKRHLDLLDRHLVGNQSG